MNDKFTIGMCCFLGGLGAGLVGILYAPDSGAGTRDRIQRKAREARDVVNAKTDEGRDYLKRRGERLVDQTNEFVERSKRAVDEQKEAVASAVEAGKAAYRTTASSSGPTGR